MNAIANPSGGTVTLRGIVVAVDSDVGAAFVLDICRHIEDLLPAEVLRSKYGLSDDGAWAGLAMNEPLQRAIAAAKTRRIHDGSAARERAQHLFLAAPAVLGGIMNDTTASARHRVDAIRELRACAGGEPEHKQSERERFTININFGTAKIHKTIELTPRPPEPETIEAEELLSPRRETGLLSNRG
jgi:hypothetical protein